MKDEFDLNTLKKSYAGFQKKHGLPSFEQLNEDFQIEKLAELETDFLLREIRKFMAEKFSNYLRFIEAILNPVNSPMFVFSVLKTLNGEDKDNLTNAYKELAKLEVEHVNLDLDYSEEKEIEFIKNSYRDWQKIKKELLEILETIKKNWDNKFENSTRGYFG